MERNFRNVKRTPNWPTLFWRNRIGPGEESLIATAMARRIGERMSNAIELPATSIPRLIARDTFRASARCTRSGYNLVIDRPARSEERRVGKECRSRGTQ